jgi:hypothetical protein
MGPGLRRDDTEGVAPQKVVIPAKAGIQYAAASRIRITVSGILDHPLSRVMTAWAALRFEYQTARHTTASPRRNPPGLCRKFPPR